MVILHLSACVSTESTISEEKKEHLLPKHGIFGWRRGVVVSGVRRMNKVTVRRARLVPGWVTVFGRVYHLGM